MSDTATKGYTADPFGGDKPNPRNIQPLTAAPVRRHSLPAPKTLKPREGFVLGESAQWGVSKRGGGVASAKFTRR